MDENIIWNRRFWQLFAVSLIIRGILAFTLDLAPDEGYYWEFARRLGLSYYDHPPMVGYMIAVLRVVLGDSVAAVRGFALFSNAVVMWLVFFVSKEFLQGIRFQETRDTVPWQACQNIELRDPHRLKKAGQRDQVGELLFQNRVERTAVTIPDPNELIHSLFGKRLVAR